MWTASADPAVSLRSSACSTLVSSRLRTRGGGPPQMAGVVVANHSLAHAQDLDRAVAELVIPLAAGGTIAVEFHHGARLLRDTQFDLICHPHRTYLSVAALLKAFSRHGLTISEAAEIPVH